MENSIGAKKEHHSYHLSVTYYSIGSFMASQRKTGVALYDCTGADNTELSFRKGQRFIEGESFFFFPMQKREGYMMYRTR